MIIVALTWSVKNSKNDKRETSGGSTQTQNFQPDQTANSPQDTTSAPQSTDSTKITEPETFFTTEEFLKKNSALTSSQVEFIKKLTDFYNPITDGSNEHSTVITSLTDAENSNITYVSYSAWDPYADEFYRMDSKTDKTETILKSDSQAYELELYGQQGHKLLFLKKDRGDSPGPCSNMWTYVYENPIPDSAQEITDGHYNFRVFQSLDLNNIKAGLKYFPVPKEKYELEKKVEEKCSAEFDAE